MRSRFGLYRAVLCRRLAWPGLHANAPKPILDEADKQGFRIIELTLDQVCELHAARELYSNALQGNIAYSGAETLAWLQAHFESFLNDLAFASATVERQKIDPVAKANAPTPQAPSLELDKKRLQLVLDIVREQRIVDISIVLSKLGSPGLRDPLLRSVEMHPNLRAHPGP